MAKFLLVRPSLVLVFALTCCTSRFTRSVSNPNQLTAAMHAESALSLETSTTGGASRSIGIGVTGMLKHMGYDRHISDVTDIETITIRIKEAHVHSPV